MGSDVGSDDVEAAVDRDLAAGQRVLAELGGERLALQQQHAEAQQQQDIPVAVPAM